MTSLKTSIKTITYLSDTGCLEIQGASLICIYFAIAMAVLIESSEQTRIRRQQYFQQYEVPNETHKNVVIENSIKSQLI
ncbi:hypothetical protein [Salmonella enterica]|uniref:hypothetical protein n=1 Tax=Salmonella enterica TaxID=28901 RepID=UPI001F4DA873|nr:hypothetical protein [Salmonella enterica]